MDDGGELHVPGLVRERAASGGGAGARWLHVLPDVVAALADRWALQLGDPYTGGTAGYVVAARDAAGEEVVLKVAMPLDEDEVAAFGRAVAVHRLAEGRGCARLVAHDDDACAVVLERLGPNLAELGVPLPDVLEAVASTLRAFWRPIDTDVALPTGPEKAAWLARMIVTTWERLDRPCPQAVIDHAIRCCDERSAAFDRRHAVLVHGDAHGWNTVRAGDVGYAFVDPEGVWGEPAQDLGVLMREYNEPLAAGDTARLVRERAELLASWCDVDPHAVWQWGFIERVSTGLANLRDFDGDGGALFLHVAELSARG